MSSLTNLPEDVLINKILLKLDTISLVNLRCVCKILRSLITNPDFVKMHCHDQFNNNHPLVLVSLKKNLFCTLNFNGIDIDLSRPERVEISTPFMLPWVIGSCNGLLCLVDKVGIDQYPPCLWNPATKEYKKLPPPLPLSVIVDPARLTNYTTYGFGYDRIIDDYYKVIIQCDHFCFCHNSIAEFQVYTLGTDTWRRIDKNLYESCCMVPFGYHLAGVFVSGAVHWIGYLGRETRIIAFDIEKEMFRAEVRMPRSRLNHVPSICSLTVLRGCLCIHGTRIDYDDNRVRMDVWMMKEYGVMDSWTKLFKIKDSSAFQYSSIDPQNFKVLKFCESGEFLVSMNRRDPKVLILYDPINKKSRKVELEKITSFTGCMEIHIHSLVSLKTGIYMGRVNKQVLEGKTEKESALEEEKKKKNLHLKMKNKNNMHVLRGCLCM